MSLKSLFINHTEGQKETCCTRGSSNYSRGRGGSSPGITSFYAPWGHDAAAASSWGTNYCVESRAAFAFTDRRFWGFVPRHLSPTLLFSAVLASCLAEVRFDWDRNSRVRYDFWTESAEWSRLRASREGRRADSTRDRGEQMWMQVT